MKRDKAVNPRYLRTPGAVCGVLAATLLAGLPLGAAEQEEEAPMQVEGSSVVAQALSVAAPEVREKLGFGIRVIAAGGSTGGLASVGQGSAEVAMTTREVSAQDRAAYPKKKYHGFQIGMQVMALIVPADVWASGVRAVTKKQMQGIYERDIQNWKEIGGPDQPIKFFNTEEGRGPWEVFALWLYGDLRKAPLGKFEKVTTAEETRNLVEFNAGSLGVVPLNWADGKSVFALSVKTDSGELVTPSPENLRDGKYPLARPLMLASGERPTGRARKLIEFMMSPRGQEILAKTDFVPQEKISGPLTPP